MLNGKFFTGLPPKMIDKNNASRNRMESHFFWPDDTTAVSATETRLKRRSSMQSNSNNRPVYEKQTSSLESNEVDTKDRFSKEFSKSSIHFCDNLNDNSPTTKTRSRLQADRGIKKSEIAEKPTATKLELPESVIDEAYTKAKKSQAYTSKIQFYDFLNEEDDNGRHQNSRNNLRKPKMDMNDKREMELNSKNSPKLQMMKRDARSLSEEKEMAKLNNREVTNLERSKPTKEINVNQASREEDISRRSNTSPFRMLPTKNSRFISDTNSYSVSDRDGRYSGSNARTGQFISNKSDSEMYPRYNNSVLPKYEDEHSGSKDAYEYRRHSSRIQQDMLPEDMDEYPKYRNIENINIKRQNNRPQFDNENFNDYEDDIGYRMKNTRVTQGSPSRDGHHQYYKNQALYEDESPRFSRHHLTYEDNQSKRGSVQRPDAQYIDRGGRELDKPYEEQFNTSGRSSCNRVNNNLNNGSFAEGEDYNHSEYLTQSRSPAGVSQCVGDSTTADTNNNSPQKHLRSSLCFHDGAIIAENDATVAPTSMQRRNARSSATKRVSVGLPD